MLVVPAGPPAGAAVPRPLPLEALADLELLLPAPRHRAARRDRRRAEPVGVDAAAGRWSSTACG